MSNKILVIIPMYGQEKYTKNCIESTKKNHGLEYHEVDILIIDDGSKKPFIFDDEGVESISVIRLENNSGFTAAVNTGIIFAQKKDYEYVLLLNNDTIPEENFLKELVDNMEPNVGITGSIRTHADKTVAICGSDLIRGFQYFAETEIPSKPFDCNIIPFACVLLRMDMIREIGLLDKKYKNHCSDTEYCIRAKMNGWRVVLVPESKVFHHLSVTTTANNILVDDDQKKWIETLACLPYAQVMASMPLDGEANTWGRISFEVYKK